MFYLYLLSDAYGDYFGLLYRQKLRRLEVALIEYRESLEERGIKNLEEIEKKVAVYRKRLQSEYGLSDSGEDGQGNSKFFPSQGNPKLLHTPWSRLQFFVPSSTPYIFTNAKHAINFLQKCFYNAKLYLLVLIQLIVQDQAFKMKGIFQKVNNCLVIL